MTPKKQNLRGNVRLCLSALAAGSLTTLAAAQPPAGTGQPPTQPTAQPGTPSPVVKLEDLPPTVRLGVRVSTVRTRTPILSTVVIVPDAASYIAAMHAWSTSARFPVLIDDGSWSSREAIARFVRGFGPERVVRFSTDAKPVDTGAGLRAAIESAAAAAWDCADPAKLAEHWKSLGFVPPGVVIAHPSDPAWTGALALAAGHGQPILWLNARPLNTTLNDWYPIDKLDEFIADLHTQLAALPWKWNALGDDIESVTLCQSAPVKVSNGTPSRTTTYAITDIIGREAGVITLPATDPKRTRRWAWAAQVVGNEWQAAYTAMCSLFLPPGDAWLFDGYDDAPPWNGWDSTAAAAHFQNVGFRTLLDDGDRHGLEDWRRRAAGIPRGGDPGVEPRKDPPAGLLESRRGVDASLILVNSSGNADFFDLKPGQAKPADVPFLNVPAAVHFVHSWSATTPGDRDTVAGRWLERGVFAYFGSTYEPYLQSFVPTPVVAQRLLYSIPFAAAVRPDNAEPWKLTVLGDPLYCVSRPVVRSPNSLPAALTVTPVADALPEQLKSLRFADALLTLRLLGKDQNAASLLAAIIKDQPDALTPEVALAGLSAAFTEAQPEVFARVYAAALPRIADDPALAACKDMIWHAVFGRATALTQLEADLLAQSMRAGSLARDAAEAARAMSRARGPEAARSVIARAKAMTTDEATLQEIIRIAP